MGLVVENLHLKNFRSYHAFDFEPHDRLTVIVGPNAVGKTNLIEALQLLTSTESFRRSQWADVVRWGEEKALLTMDAQGDGRSLKTELVISATGRREYRINGKFRRRIADVVGVLPSVVFSPDDLRLVKDSAERRRATLDSLGTQLSPTYLKVKTEYERVVKQRNSLLKTEVFSEDQLLVIDDQLISAGTRFTQLRLRLFNRLVQAMKEAHQGVCADTTLDPHYFATCAGWASGDDIEIDEASFREALRKRSADERARKTSLVGPHRDDITFDINNRDARTFASQGQQRTIALAWKLAEVMVVREVSGQPPLLLLDDVMSELDASRRHALTNFVGTTTQTIVTTTNLDYFDPDLLERGRVLRLEG